MITFTAPYYITCQRVCEVYLKVKGNKINGTLGTIH